jgi:hypothetical protein
MAITQIPEIFDYIRAEHQCYLTFKSDEELIIENNIRQLDLWLKYEIDDLQLYEAIQ